MLWDARPTLPQTAAAMCDAANEFAAFIGVNGTQLRIKLAELRTLGYQAAIDAAELEFAIEKDSSEQDPVGL